MGFDYFERKKSAKKCGARKNGVVPEICGVVPKNSFGDSVLVVHKKDMGENANSTKNAKRKANKMNKVEAANIKITDTEMLVKNYNIQEIGEGNSQGVKMEEGNYHEAEREEGNNQEAEAGRKQQS